MIQIFLLILVFSAWQSFGQINNLDAVSDSLVKDIPPDVNLVWLGESHGTKLNTELAFEWFQKLDQKRKVDYLLLESGFLDGEELNRFMATGDSTILIRKMHKHGGTFEWTKEKYQYYLNIFRSQKDKPVSERTRFIGIDIAHDFWNYHAFIRDSILPRFQVDSSLAISRFPARLSNFADYQNYYRSLNEDIQNKDLFYRKKFAGDYERLWYLVRNVHFLFLSKSASSSGRWNQVRDSLIYENFKVFQARIDFKNSCSFAFWGQDHVLQEKSKSNTEFISCRIKKNNPELKQYSCYLLYSKSTFNLPAFFIPKALRIFFGKKPYVKTAGLNNDKIFVRLSGTRYLKKKCSKNQNYCFFSTASLPDRYDYLRRQKGISNRAYVQSVVLIRNSLASQPLQNWKRK